MKLPPLITLAALIAPGAIAQEIDRTPPSAEGAAFFEKKIRPALIESCYGCHSPDERVRGGLDLSSRDGTLPRAGTQQKG